MIMLREFSSPCGELLLGEYDGRLCLCDWRYRRNREAVDRRIKRIVNSDYRVGDSHLLQLAVTQLDEYFVGERECFSVPLYLAGTEFQQQVWRALQTIPFGEKVSYLQLAESLGNRKGIRAVASANGANALSLFIPCHRVVGSDGSLTGYAGGLKAKQFLLDLEQPAVQARLALE